MPAGDLPPDLLARAERHGLTRGGRAGGSWWTRHSHGLQTLAALAWTTGDGWCWGPEARAIVARFPTEREALAAALDWLDAGEPEVQP